MTASELKSAFLRKYDAITGFAAPGYEDTEISAFLTEAQLIIFKRAVATFDRTELEKKILTRLIVNKTSTTFANTYNNLTNGYVVTMAFSSNEVLYAVWEESAVYVGSTTRVRVKPVTYDRYIIDRDNPFLKPDENLIWRLDYNGSHELITNGTAIASYQMRFVRLPVPINISTSTTAEINEGFHEDIATLAAELAAKAVMKLEAMKQAPSQQQQREQ